MQKLLAAVKEAASAPGKDWLSQQLKLAEAIQDFEKRFVLGEVIVVVCMDEIPIRIKPDAHGLQILVNDEESPRMILDVFEGVIKACVFSSDHDEAKVAVTFDDDGIIEDLELPKP